MPLPPRSWWMARVLPPCAMRRVPPPRGSHEEGAAIVPEKKVMPPRRERRPLGKGHRRPGGGWYEAPRLRRRPPWEGATAKASVSKGRTPPAGEKTLRAGEGTLAEG
ncbi:Os01g0705900 [Oryza sativa Japonica Group]|uniref:Uncharacterized protein n=2 Tax=Oryza sativa subsp. japonica TaxID=39947 RepID=A0A8J8Y5K0_ORYSJ|nr:hypothetical protein OsJ_03183 [Oryza sativa Japonica Group]BAS73935.1 Os01g0705900 [Oryza sativa Japonica Group]